MITGSKGRALGRLEISSIEGNEFLYDLSRR